MTSGRRAVHDQRDGEFGPGGELCFDHACGLHGVRQYGDDCRRGHVLDHGEPGGQRELRRRDAGNAELHGESGIADDHVRRVEQRERTASAPFTVSATASSGLAVSFASTTTSVCTVAGSTVTIVAVGTCSITASQAGNATYAPATPVTQSFTVNHGIADHHLRRAEQRDVRRFAVHGSRDGEFGFGGELCFDHDIGLHGVRQHGDDCRAWLLLDHGEPGRKRQLWGRDAGNAEFHGQFGIADHHLRRAEQRDVRRFAVHGRRDGEFGAGGELCFDHDIGLHGGRKHRSRLWPLVRARLRPVRQVTPIMRAAAPVTQSFTVNPASQTITFGALSNVTYGVSPFTVTATASSGLAVSFASTTTSVCTVAGSTVTIVALGSCSITASQAGNASYGAATPVTQSFTVNSASQTITFGALSNVTYGVSPFTVTATASSGLAVSFASTTTSVCTVAGSTVTIVALGSCSITASQAGNASYGAATPVTQSFTVNSASQTITFGGAEQRDVRRASVHGHRHGEFGFGGELCFDHDIGLHGGRQHGHDCRAWLLLDHGEPGRKRQLWGRDAGNAELHGQFGIADHHLRRAEQRDVRRFAVHGCRDGEFGFGGELCFDHDIGLHGGRQHGDDCCAWLLLDHGEPGRKRQLWGRDAGNAELHGQFGIADHHLRRAEQRDVRRFAVHGQRHGEFGFGGELCFDHDSRLHRGRQYGHDCRRWRLLDHREPGRERQLRGRDAGIAELHGQSRVADHYVRAIEQREPRRRAVLHQRDGEFGFRREFRFDYACRLHGLRQRRHDRRPRRVLDYREPGGQRELCGRDAGNAEFHGQPGAGASRRRPCPMECRAWPTTRRSPRRADRAA